jgi:biopolymer transport protein ExbD
MADKRRAFDVWIVETNTVYRDVPYTVVADWLQQGRLLEDDRARPAGAGEFQPLRGQAEFAPYFPKPEPHRAEDQAEALEPVQLDFGYRHGAGDEDEDVDMIPLIDVSLVLLIFFMMTTTAVTASALLPTPPAEFGTNIVNRDFWVGINSDDQGEPTAYFLGQGERKLGGDVKTLDELRPALNEHLAANTRRVQASIMAHPNLKSGYVQDVFIELQKRPQVEKVRIQVSESKP